MAGKTIPDLDPAATGSLTDQIPVSQAGLTKRVTVSKSWAPTLLGTRSRRSFQG